MQSKAHDRAGSYARVVRCIFCEGEGKMTREHVFPRWLEQIFPDVGTVDYVRRTVTSDADERHKRPGPGFDVVVRDVCDACNTGWMSALETQVRPILTPMFCGEPRVLSAPDQQIVATWATKTMLTLQGVNMGGTRCVSAENYRWFYRKKAPLPSSHVWLCHYVGVDQWPVAAHQYGFTASTTGMPTPSDGDPINCFGVAYAIGPVAFWLFGHDLPGPLRTGAASDDAHLLIWPALGPDVRWPPAKPFGTADDLNRLARRMPDGVQPQGKLQHLIDG